MTIKNSQAKKLFWSQYSESERSLLMSLRAKKMWKKKTTQQKKDRALLMLTAKKKLSTS